MNSENPALEITSESSLEELADIVGRAIAPILLDLDRQTLQSSGIPLPRHLLSRSDSASRISPPNEMPKDHPHLSNCDFEEGLEGL